MPAEHCSYDAPYGGMFLWLNFHNLGSMTSFELFRRLADAGVICVPGEDFLVPDIHTTLGKTKSSNSDLCLRLTFAAASPAQIRAGIEKLGVCIKDITASQKSK
jgi:DNA-binding transcriptional MocR family regulator